MTQPDMLHNRYRIERALGYGGFATTYLATDTHTQERCAIKSLSFQKIAEWKTWELFEREANILKSLEHPQVPKYIDSFMIETTGEMTFHLVQEYVEGRSLRELIRRGTQFSEREVLRLTLKITHVLEYLHSFSPPIIHRDIKPGNIIITPDDRVVLIDFGAVREKMLSDYTRLGGGSTIVGTYGYMPIEQFQGRALPASDLYSLGITLIALLSRKEPLDIDNRQYALNYRPHVNISAGFATVLDKLIAPDWTKRYQTATALRRDIEKLLAGKPVLRIPDLRPALSISFGVLLLVLLGTFLILRNQPLTLESTPQETSIVETPADDVQAEDPIYPNSTTIMLFKQNEELSIEALIQKSRAQFLAHDELSALRTAIQAAYRWKQGQYWQLHKSIYDEVADNLADILSAIHEKNRLEGHTGNVNAAAFSADGQYIASGSDDQTVRIWESNSGRIVQTLSPDAGPIQDVAFSPDGNILAAGASQAVFLWKTATWEQFATLKGCVNIISQIAFSSDGKHLASSCPQNSSVHLWDVATQHLMRSVAGLSAPIRAMEFHPDGSMIALGQSGEIVLVDAAKGNELRRLPAYTSLVTSLAFSPDGTYLAAAEHLGTAITLWDLSSETSPVMLHGDAGTVLSLAFHTNSRVLASGSTNSSIRLWDIQSQRQIATFGGHAYAVTHVAFQPNGSLLASASVDDTLKLWNIADILDEASSSRINFYQPDVDFGPDGSLMAFEHASETDLVEDPNLDALLAQGCSWLQGYAQHNPNASDDRWLCQSFY